MEAQRKTGVHLTTPSLAPSGEPASPHWGLWCILQGASDHSEQTPNSSGRVGAFQSTSFTESNRLCLLTPPQADLRFGPHDVLCCSAILESACPSFYAFLSLLSRQVVSDSATPQTAARQASLSFTISCSLLKLKSAELVMLSIHLILSPSSPPQFYAQFNHQLFQKD